MSLHRDSSAVFAWSAVALGALLLTGCATGNAEEDAFFRTGWLIPTKLDKEPAVSTPTDDASIGAER